jgi:hypothetical protein
MSMSLVLRTLAPTTLQTQRAALSTELAWPPPVGLAVPHVLCRIAQRGYLAGGRLQKHASGH